VPLKIIREDITKVSVDAIVNAANQSLLGGGGVDGAIHRAAGSQLLEECKTLKGCKTGQAKITKGYLLPAKHVIHTVGPIWKDGTHHEALLLANCYQNALALAKEYHLRSIAFPLISTGAFKFPKDIALRIAISSIGEFLLHNDMLVYIVVFDKASFQLSKKLFASIEQYIDDNYVDEHEINRFNRNDLRVSHDFESEARYSLTYESNEVSSGRNLDDLIKNKDETFSTMLLRLIKEKGLTDSEVYKKANIDRKLFSKIRNDENYNPSKPTAIAFAIALTLNLDETKDLLQRAGFALSNSRKFDVIIQYFIEEENFNIFEINEALFAFDQSLLGV
jgi:O-acetyl-ADP-ribose deacetylase (regulator of RNase III)/transcriptional regulator with XRE-family HTH domain